MSNVLSIEIDLDRLGHEGLQLLSQQYGRTKRRRGRDKSVARSPDVGKTIAIAVNFLARQSSEIRARLFDESAINELESTIRRASCVDESELTPQELEALDTLQRVFSRRVRQHEEKFYAKDEG